MGTIKQGILGGFSGKVGTVIGSSWKGISYMRGQAQHVKNPRSAGQVNQHTKFALVMGFLQPVVPYIRIGYKSQAAKQTEFNAAFSYTIKNAVTGSYPSYALDFTKIVVSKGGLTQVTGATRTTHTQSLTVPNDWEGDKVEVYLGMVSEDGKEVADSIYLGEVTLTPA